jgi:hypothetical protein
MDQFQVQCPKCQHKFSPEAALQHQVSHLLEIEKKSLNDKWSDEIKKLKVKEAGIAKKEQEIEHEITQRLKNERQQLTAKLKAEIAEEQNLELSELRKTILEQQQKITSAKALELQFEKYKREAAEKEKELEIKMEHKLAEEQVKMEETISRNTAEKYQLELAEKDKKMKDLSSKLEEAQRQAKQGSMQLQGEVQELAIENKLRELFPQDIIEEVPKGCNGQIAFKQF